LRPDGHELDVRFHERKHHGQVRNLLDAHVRGELHPPVGLHRLPCEVDCWCAFTNMYAAR